MTNVNSYAFYYCVSLTDVYFPLVTNIDDRAFYCCNNLTTADFPEVTNIGIYAFAKCEKLIVANFPKTTHIEQYAFNFCNNMVDANFPLVTDIGMNAFSYCSALVCIDLPSVTSIESTSFTHTYNLKKVILRNTEQICVLSSYNAFNYCYHLLGTVNTTYNPDGLKDCYIYVPSALIEEYKAATNWSTFADQFRALEDYTVDGTTTGELDESKI